MLLIDAFCAEEALIANVYLCTRVVVLSNGIFIDIDRNQSDVDRHPYFKISKIFRANFVANDYLNVDT